MHIACIYNNQLFLLAQENIYNKAGAASSIPKNTNFLPLTLKWELEVFTFPVTLGSEGLLSPAEKELSL